MRAGTPPIAGFRERGSRWRLAGTVAGCLLLFCVALDSGAWAATDEPRGRYVIAKVLDGGDRTAEPYAGIVEIKTRRTVCTLTWRIRGGQTSRRLQALGLWDKEGAGEPVLCASMNTGGAAYGTALYRRGKDGRWQGGWVTSVDDGAELGEMRIDTGSNAASLVGRHRIAGSRGRAGSFAGAVTITAQGEFLELAYEVGGIPVYRGLGVLLRNTDGSGKEDERLAVAWSYGSTPALAIYSLDGDGSLTGRRVSLRLGEAQIRNERLARSVPGTDPSTGQLLLPPPVINEAEAPLPGR